MTGATDIRVGFFCKHYVSLDTVKEFVALKSNIVFIVVMREMQHQPWYDELRRISAGINARFIEVNRIRETENVELIRSLKPDVVFSVMFTQVIPSSIIRIPPLGIINFHPSFLPAYRGPNPVNWAIINGESYTGLTAHFMSEAVDAGPVIKQQRIEIGEDDNVNTVSEKIMSLVPPMAVQVLEMVKRGQVETVVQDESISSYYPRRTEADDMIDWSKTSRSIYNLVRGLYYPLPGAIAIFRGNKIKIRESRIVETKGKDIERIHPGTIISLDAQGLTVKTGDGAVLVTKIDFDDKLNCHPSHFFYFS